MKESVEDLLQAVDRWFDECFSELSALDCYFIDQMHNEWYRAQQGKCTEQYAVKNIKLLYNNLSGQTTEMKEKFAALNNIHEGELRQNHRAAVQLSLF